MPRYQLPRWEKGTRPPNSGRVKGTPNRASVEARQLVDLLVTDADYQRRLAEDFRARKLHPTIEALIWSYHLGRPPQRVEVNGSINVSAKLEEERRIFAALELPDLERLAAESQAIVDRAAALSRARLEPATPQDVAVATDLPEVSEKTLVNWAGSDKQSSVTEPQPDASGEKTPDEPAG